jgi:hypothetical protein
MCAEDSTILSVVTAVDIWRSLRITVFGTYQGMHYRAQGFRLETFQNFYVGSGSPTPELYSLSPDWFEYCFIYEKFVACREF